MSLRLRIADDLPLRFPRVSGDEPYDRTHPTAARMFSPRERG